MEEACLWAALGRYRSISAAAGGDTLTPADRSGAANAASFHKLRALYGEMRK